MASMTSLGFPVKKSLTDKDFQLARERLLRMHHESGVGHIGGNLSALDAMLLVFNEFLGEEDVFILSKGHSAGALYTALWSIGELTDTDLQTFHKDDTLLAGHPPSRGLAAVPFATGSLGHGLSLSSGTALALKLKGSSSKVICLTSDGEWQEGSTWEALIFAAHHQLGNLTVLVDHNGLQGFGTTTEIASMNPLWERIKGFDVEIIVVDGHDPAAIREAMVGAHVKPRFVILNTTKGRGVSFMEDRMEWHYLPLKADRFDEAIEEQRK